MIIRSLSDVSSGKHKLLKRKHVHACQKKRTHAHAQWDSELTNREMLMTQQFKAAS